MSYPDNRTITNASLSALNNCLVIESTPSVVEPIVFEYGTIASDTGLERASTNRIRTGMYDLRDKTVRIDLGSSGARYGVYFYDSSESFISGKAWLTSSTYSIPDNAVFLRVCMSYPDNRTITNNDIIELNNCLIVHSANQ